MVNLVWKVLLIISEGFRWCRGVKVPRLETALLGEVRGMLIAVLAATNAERMNEYLMTNECRRMNV
jgi:hypothetical protein